MHFSTMTINKQKLNALLTAIIWSPIWILPSCSTALLFVMLFTKIPEGSKIENSLFVFLLFMKITQINNIHPLVSKYKVLILRDYKSAIHTNKTSRNLGQKMRQWFCLINTESQSHTLSCS